MMEVRGTNTRRTANLRKRPLEARKRDGSAVRHPKSYESPSSTDMDLSCSPTKLATFSEHHVQDEVEEHFKRSLAKMKGHPSPSPKPLVVLHPSGVEEQTLRNQEQGDTLPKFHTDSSVGAVVSKSYSTAKIPKYGGHSPSHSSRVSPLALASTDANTISQATAAAQKVQSATAGLGNQAVVKSTFSEHRNTRRPLVVGGSSQASPSRHGAVHVINSSQSQSRQIALSGAGGTASGVSRAITATVGMPGRAPSRGGGSFGVTQVPMVIGESPSSLFQASQSAAVSVPVTSVPSSSAAASSVVLLSGIQQHARQQESQPSPVRIPFYTPSPQPTTPTLISHPTQQTIAESAAQTSSLVHLLDSTMTSQLMAAGNNPIFVLPSAFSQQPYILVGPTDFALQQSLQQAAAANLALASAAAATTESIGSSAERVEATGANLVDPMRFAGVSGNIMPAPGGGGYILLPTNTSSAVAGVPGMIPTPIVRVAGSNIEQQLPGVSTLSTHTSLSQPMTTTVHTSTSPITATTLNVLKTPRKTVSDGASTSMADTTHLSTSRREMSPVDINMTPATVEDHFAKALGEQWPQLKGTLQSVPQQNTVVS